LSYYSRLKELHLESLELATSHRSADCL